MKPVPGHPYVWYDAGDRGFGYQIRLYCGKCSHSMVRDCHYPPKTTAWVAHYAARHAHGVPGLHEKFSEDYHRALQQLRVA